ncbi:MAG: phenylalanine--tRNA ligase subunit alpha [Proteobacteria bacterium]|nr:phenylalanine--tRNA ligase subunit alpha [Pseudomonadota bacterium]
MSDKIKSDFISDKAQVMAEAVPEAVEALRLSYLGKKGKLTAVMEDLRNVSKEDRPAAGKAVNVVRQFIESEIEALKTQAKEWEISAILRQKPIDVTLPVSADVNIGSLHPVTHMRHKLNQVFKQLGFTIYDGPEIDTDFFNFSALNIPDHHPARDMQDTFYLEGSKNLLLRTQTSNIQIHAMLNEKPPLRIIAPGRVFRCDSDMTHTPMFHQIEGFVVDEGITFAHLKGTIDAFLKAIFGSTLATRLRPSFFPFVEPGAEFDVQCGLCHGKGCRTCKNTGWIEIGGCGMIHPNVFENVGYDSSQYSGFAFGFGIDRIAMNRFALPDLRQLFEGDYKFLGNFPVNAEG